MLGIIVRKISYYGAFLAPFVVAGLIAYAVGSYMFG